MRAKELYKTDLAQTRADQARKSSFFPALSIRHRLPLLIASLLWGVMVASVWVSYRGVRESSLEVGRERLVHLTEQLAALLQQTSAGLTAKTSAVANDAAIQSYLRSPSTTTRLAAVAHLQQFSPSQESNNIQVELWSPGRSFLMALPESTSPQSADLMMEFEQSAVPPFKVTGPLRLVKDKIIYPTVAAVKDDSGKLLGYLVRWRRFSDNKPESRKQLTELLGNQATLYFGNNRGDLWTDMVKVSAPPPGGLSSTLSVTQYKRDGDSVIALGRPIVGTPWLMVVEISERAVLTHTT